MKHHPAALLLLLLLGASRARAEGEHLPWGHWLRWGDQGDGTFENPVIPADYSDPDCIRVGSEYYAISSTFQFSPGVIILRSGDLVNWEIVGHAVPDVTQIGAAMNWTEMARYGAGIWAGAIRRHNGRFWIYFGTPDEGYFMTSAADAAGPWEPLHCVMAGKGWDDCCPFWDDDGQGYLVGTHFADNYKTYIWKLTGDGRGVLAESRVKVNEGSLCEANKLYKIGGWYYHIFSEVKGARVLMAQRSRSILGPYAERRQLTDQNRSENEPNQGGLVDTGKGGWYFLTHHGTGDWEGRCASLLPVRWVDGWPIVGATTAAGEPGRMAWVGRKPVTGLSKATPQASDEFSSSVLAPQWEWNHQPRAEMWSLSERPGWLRLKAFRPVHPNAVMTAGNTLTQRSFRTRASEVIVKLDLGGLVDGQKAGLCHFGGSHCSLGVKQEGLIRTLEFKLEDDLMPGPTIAGADLWIRSTWGLDGRSQFSYSTDGRAFSDFGRVYPLSWGHYRGDRIGVYCYNDKQEAGHVDVDFVHYDYNRPLGSEP